MNEHYLYNGKIFSRSTLEEKYGEETDSKISDLGFDKAYEFDGKVFGASSLKEKYGDEYESIIADKGISLYGQPKTPEAPKKKEPTELSGTESSTDTSLAGESEAGTGKTVSEPEVIKPNYEDDDFLTKAARGILGNSIVNAWKAGGLDLKKSGLLRELSEGQVRDNSDIGELQPMGYRPIIMRDMTAEEKEDKIGQIEEIGAQLRGLPQSQLEKDLSQALLEIENDPDMSKSDKVLTTVGTIATSGQGAMALLTRSMASQVPYMPIAVAAAVTGSAPILALGSAVSGYSAEKQLSIVEGIRHAGLDPENPDDLHKLFNDKEVQEKVSDFTTARGVSIGAVEGVFSLFGGKVLSKIKNPVVRPVSQFIADVVGQGVGEGSAQVASTGEVNAVEVGAEIALGGGMAAAGTFNQEVRSGIDRYKLNNANVQRGFAQKAIAESKNLGELERLSIDPKDKALVAEYDKKKLSLESDEEIDAGDQGSTENTGSSEVDGTTESSNEIVDGETEAGSDEAGSGTEAEEASPELEAVEDDLTENEQETVSKDESESVDSEESTTTDTEGEIEEKEVAEDIEPEQEAPTAKAGIAIDESKLQAVAVKEGGKPKAGNRLFNTPLKAAKEIADKYYAKAFGKSREKFTGTRQLDEENSKRISDAYEAMEHTPNDPETKAAYEALSKETADQYQSILDEGYEIEINNDEPYANSQEMIDDLENNKRLKIFSTESGFGSQEITEQQRAENPLLRDSGFKDKNGQPLLMNDVFRFVHDFFGHSELGNSFGKKGEENAWQVHARMFSPEARRAMTTETRGQNSFVNFSGVNQDVDKIREQARKLREEGKIEEAQALVDQIHEEGSFADQKIGLLPEEFSEVDAMFTGDEGVQGVMDFSNPETMMADLNTLSERMGVQGQVKERKVESALSDNYVTRAASAVLSKMTELINVGDKALANTVGKKGISKLENTFRKATKNALQSDNKHKQSLGNATRNLIPNLGLDTNEQTQKRRFSGAKNMAHETVQRMHDSLKGWTDNNPMMEMRIHQALDPELAKHEAGEDNIITYDDLTPKEKEVFAYIRSLNNFIHETNHNLGLIDDATYEKFKGQYIARAYAEIDGAGEFANIKNEHGDTIIEEIYGKRKDLDEIDGLTAISDPVYLTTKRLAQTLQNQGVQEYATQIDERGVALEEAEVIEKGLSGAYRKLEKRKGGYNTYGPLTDKWVPNHIAEDFQGMSYSNEVMNTVFDLFKGYDRHWFRQLSKKGLTVYNPMTRAVNIMGSLAFAFGSNVDAVTLIKNRVRAKKSLDAFDENAQLLMREGILSTSAGHSEFDGLIKNPKTKAAKLMAKMDKWAVDTYGQTDDVAKIAAFISLKEKGYTDAQAVNEIAEGFQNYATVGKAFVTGAKTPIFGPPFIRFKADLTRIMYNKLKNRPMTMATFAGMLYMASEMMSEVSDEDENVKKVRTSRPFIPKMAGIPLVWQTPVGEVNVAKWVTPYYAYDMGANEDVYSQATQFLPYQFRTNEDGVLPVPVMSDPTLSWLMEIAVTDKDFRQKSISNPEGKTNIELGEKTLNRVVYAAREAVPLIPTKVIHDLVLSATTGEDYYGRNRDMSKVIMSRLIRIEDFGSTEAKKQVRRNMDFIDYEMDKLKAKINKSANENKRKLQSMVEKGVPMDEIIKKQQKMAMDHAEFSEKIYDKLNKLNVTKGDAAKMLSKLPNK